ncbi:hypothetical protein HHK36_029621 [Tetracentron sinense]|uniref:Transmembrane protein n=1 Tax=Tetracentron sinense TaxID=13715 RepID=A0A835CZT2_TETSI|nr:hypothetical protein HHK36_029621 [Tetracentron sinense]
MSLSPPVVDYPNTVTTQPSTHPNGSFGTVFIVLAVIVVLAAIACFLGRFCNRRFSRQKAKPNHSFHPKERDIEIGFKKKIPTAMPAGAGNGETKEPKVARDGCPREEIDLIELKAVIKGFFEAKLRAYVDFKWVVDCLNGILAAPWRWKSEIRSAKQLMSKFDSCVGIGEDGELGEVRGDGSIGWGMDGLDVYEEQPVEVFDEMGALIDVAKQN